MHIQYSLRKPLRVALHTTVATFLALSLLPAHSATVAGSTPGDFSVSSGGSANYRIPIQIPPGVAGMEPRLNLIYDSQSDNGSLGVGWSLSGLSSISRCAKARVADGESSSVNFVQTDRYCLNGQRLMLVSGTHGTAGAQYRTERESFSNITAYGSAGNGPAYFIEKTKAGLTIEYGNTTDSRIEAQGKTTPRAWAQNKVSDAKGNYLTASYTKDSTNGSYYANRIDYTGNATSSPVLSPSASVQISYQSRPDSETAYQAGSMVKLNQRVSNIKTFNGATLVKDYQLSYDQSAHTNRSRLKTLTECDVSGNCLQPVSLTSPTVATALTQPMAAAIPETVSVSGQTVYTHAQAGGNMQIADFNGDGKMDYMWLHVDTMTWYIAYATDTGFTAPVPALPFVWSTPSGSVTSVPTQVYGAPPVFGDPTPPTQAERPYVFFADFNGDGKIDMMWRSRNSGVPGYVAGWMVAYSTGTGFTQPMAAAIPETLSVSGQTVYTHSQASGYMQIADFNGDGKMDYMWLHLDTGTWYVAYATDTGFAAPVPALPFIWSTPSGSVTSVPTQVYGNPSAPVQGERPYIFFADFNGDGKVDMMWRPRNSGLPGYGAGWLLATAAKGNDTVSAISKAPGSTVTITYKPISDSTVYTKDSGVNAGAYPVQDMIGPFHVVSSVASSNGVGGTNTSTYTYGGLKVERNTGVGLLGFRWINSKDSATQIENYTEYRQDWPYTGMASKNETRLVGSGNAGVLKRSTPTLACKTPQSGAACVIAQRCDQTANAASCVAAASNRYFTHAASSLEQSWDLNGAAWPSYTSTTTYGLDPVDGHLYGDPTQTTITTSDGSSKTTVYEYWPADTTNWILGRPKKSTVTSVTP